MFSLTQDMYLTLSAWVAINTEDHTESGEIYSQLLDRMCTATDKWGKKPDMVFYKKVEPARDWGTYLKNYLKDVGDEEKALRWAWRCYLCFNEVQPTFEEVCGLIEIFTKTIER